LNQDKEQCNALASTLSATGPRPLSLNTGCSATASRG
jgi:hypothetical protein